MVSGGFRWKFGWEGRCSWRRERVRSFRHLLCSWQSLSSRERAKTWSCGREAVRDIAVEERTFPPGSTAETCESE